MSSISSGTTLTTALVQTADTSGVLQLQTNGTTTAVTIDTSQNVGVGVTPSAWWSSSKGFQFGATGVIEGRVGGEVAQFGSNWFINSSATYSYITTGPSTRYASNSGQHTWYNAPSGTAGNAITFTQAMTLDTSGNLLVGTTSSLGKVTIYTASGTGLYFDNAAATGGFVTFRYNSSVCGSITTGGGGTTTYATSSDYRLKEITGPLTGAKDFIMALQPKQGTWKVNGDKFAGFLAHEFADVSPSSVVGEKDAVDEEGNPVYQGIQAGSAEVIANMVSLLQEQQAMITTLQTQVTALQSKG